MRLGWGQRVTVEMFRIRFGWKSGNVSSWDTELFESRHAFALRLLDLEAEVQANPEGRYTFRNRVARMWKNRGDRRSERKYHHVPTKSPLVEQLVDGEWVPVEYEFVPAVLKIDGKEYVDDRS